MSRLIVRPKCLTDAEAAGLEGTFVDESYCDEIACGEEVDCFTEDGEPLFLLRPGALDGAVCYAAWRALWTAARVSFNRGAAAGGAGRRALKLDGTRSNTTTADPVLSGNVGSYPRTVRQPFCRPTAWSARNVLRLNRALPLFSAMDAAFAGEPKVRDRYEAQAAAARLVPEDYLFPGTTLSTAAVNLNFRTRVHKDRGDLPEGFGVMTAFRGGQFTGGVLVFPQYRVGVDLRTRDVLLSDVHQWHGNTAMVGPAGRFFRLSVVCFHLTRMRHCLPPAEELKHLKRRKPGDPLH